MKMKVEYDAWMDQAFYVPRRSDPPGPLPAFSHLRTTLPGRARTIRDGLVALIDSAMQRVFICSFLIGGEEIRDALRRAVRRLRGHVYVITSLDEKTLQRSLAYELDEISEDALIRERKSFEAVTRYGVYVRGAEGCHAKFCVVDDRAALVGSANFDPNGLDLDQARTVPCGELGLVLIGEERVAPLAALFRHLWKCGCQREAPPLREAYRLSGVVPSNEPPPAAPSSADAVVWTGFGTTAILQAIRGTIDSAQESLALGSYSFTGMRERTYLILDALAEARRRGVRVEMLLRDRSRDLKELSSVLDMGIAVRANRDNHAKYAIADGEYGVLFSANFDGVHGLTSGIETGVRLRTEEATEVAAWHAMVWDEAPSQAGRWRTVEEFAESMPDVQVKVPPFLGNRLLIGGDAGAVAQCTSILNGPCLLATDGDGSEPGATRLLGFDAVVRLDPAEGGMRAAVVERNESEYWPLPRVIAARNRGKGQLWLPRGLEVHLK